MNTKTKDFIREFAMKRRYPFGKGDYGQFYRYGTNSGKFGYSRLLEDILFTEFTPKEILFFTKVVHLLKWSYYFESACVVKLTQKNMKGFVDKNDFKAFKKKFCDRGILVATPTSNVYIVDVLYINKSRKNYKKEYQ